MEVGYLDSSGVGRSPSGVPLVEGASAAHLSEPDPSNVGWSPSGGSLGTDRIGGSEVDARWIANKKQILKRKFEQYRQQEKSKEDQEPPKFLELFA